MYASVFNNKLQNLQKGCGRVEDNANMLFGLLKQKSEDQIINRYSDINASLDIFGNLHNASVIQNSAFNASMVNVSIGSYFHTKLALLYKKCMSTLTRS